MESVLSDSAARLRCLQDAVNEAGLDVQSLETAQTNGRGLLTSAYQMIGQLFADLNCDFKMMFPSLTDLPSQSVSDRNILLYLATIESRVQQLLPAAKQHRHGGREINNHVDDTTISWRIEHRKADQPFHSPSHKSHAANHYNSMSVDQISFIAPHVALSVIPFVRTYSVSDHASLLDSTKVR